MKNILLILLIAIGLTISCYSIPQVYHNNQDTLAPEQELRDRPGDSYNPLQVGNKWWRTLSDGSHQLVREVVDSMLINNHVYYNVVGFFDSGSNRWYRNEGDTVFVFDEFNMDNNPDTIELLYEDFSIIGHSWIYHDFIYYQGLWNCFSDGDYFLSAYGIPTYLRYHDYYFPDAPMSWETRCWAQGFGITYLECNGSNIYSSACRIDGISYGETVSILDEEIPSLCQIDLSSYPNPFKDEVTIQYDFDQPHRFGTLAIYNIKGQLVMKTKVMGSGKYKWNGYDDNGQKLSYGTYLCIVKADKQSKTVKILLSK